MDHSDSRHLQAQQQTPYYAEQGGEAALFAHAFEQKLPVLIKGPTGCGKTRFVEHMAARLGRPLITVSCHDDLTAADLVGRYLIGDGNTVWNDGPLARAVRTGAICYLDEVVEARKDTTVVLHPLADDRRQLPIERTGELLQASPVVPAAEAVSLRTVLAPALGANASSEAEMARTRTRGIRNVVGDCKVG